MNSLSCMFPYQAFIATLLFCMCGMSLFAQKPAYSWDFSGTRPEQSRTGTRSLKFGSAFDITQDEEGNYLTCKGGSPLLLALIEDGSHFSLAFTFRLSMDTYGHRGETFMFNDQSFRLYLWRQMLGVTAALKTGKAEARSKGFQVPLRTVGARSYGYYFDGNWHHLAFRFNGDQGKASLWVDGSLLEEWEIEKGSLINMGEDGQAWGMISKEFIGEIADINLFDKPLSDERVKALYNASRSKKDNPLPATRNVNSPQLELDTREYPPQHPNVQLSAIEQLRQFPAPRYKAGHTLRPLYNWMGMTHFSGYYVEGTSRAQALKQGEEIQEEMALNWHYMIAIENSRFARASDKFEESSPRIQSVINLAKRYPELPVSVTTLWAQLDYRVKGQPGVDANIIRNDLPMVYYMNDGKGNLLDRDGKIGKYPRVSLVAPRDKWEDDGEVQAIYIQRIINWLGRPIDFINENGEVPPDGITQYTGMLDPTIKADYQQKGSPDWERYEAEQKLRVRYTYKKEFTEKLTGLGDCEFSWYGVDGGSVGRWDWEVSRQIHGRINGQYYATPDFYPRWPNNWRKWKGAWRGWAWIEVCRVKEIPLGDRLYSPFVAAGWAIEPEKNLRPSQWLGLLKMLPITGAEFFYTGFFNETRGKGPHTFPDPANYAWQAVMPAYAQAVTSYYEDILRNGNLLNDANGKPIVTWPVADPRILLVVRKHDTRPEYIIGGTIQPESNTKGNVPDSLPVKIQLGEKTLQFFVRRQGSVYRYNDTDTPTFYQLDTWHELGHPLWWEKRQVIEGELFHATEGGERMTLLPASNVEGDFRTAPTVVLLKAGNKVHYQVKSRVQENSPHKLCLHARVPDGGKALVEVRIDGRIIGQIRFKGSKWKSLETANFSLANANYARENPTADVTFTVKSGNLQLDRFSFETP